MAGDDDELVLLMQCASPVEATATKAMLEAEGIDAYVHGEHHRAQLGFLGAYVDLRLMVRASDLDDARELLEEAKYAEHLPPDDDDEPVEDDLSMKRWREHAGEEPPPAEAPDIERSWRRRRSPVVPALLGLVLGLGTGHLYAGRLGVAAVLFVLQVLPNLVLDTTGWIIAFAVGLRLLDAVGGALAVRKDNAALTLAEPDAASKPEPSDRR